MKKLILPSLLTFLAFAGGYAIAKSTPTHFPPEYFIPVNMETPGNADRAHPDTCIAWMDDNNDRWIQLAKDTHVSDSLLQVDIKNGKATKVW